MGEPADAGADDGESSLDAISPTALASWRTYELEVNLSAPAMLVVARSEGLLDGYDARIPRIVDLSDVVGIRLELGAIWGVTPIQSATRCHVDYDNVVMTPYAP